MRPGHHAKDGALDRPIHQGPREGSGHQRPSRPPRSPDRSGGSAGHDEQHPPVRTSAHLPRGRWSALAGCGDRNSHPPPDRAAWPRTPKSQSTASVCGGRFPIRPLIGRRPSRLGRSFPRVFWPVPLPGRRTTRPAAWSRCRRTQKAKIPGRPTEPVTECRQQDHTANGRPEERCSTEQRGALITATSRCPGSKPSRGC